MRRGTLALALALLHLARPLAAQDRRCAGHDTETAARERLRARESYERATRRAGYVDPEALAAAITAASASCAAGEVRGLLLRATALHTRGDHLSAARDLDAYLAHRPLDGETDASVRAFVRELAAAIDREVGRVRVVAPDARIEQVRLGDLVVEDASAWTPVAPGPLRVEVRAASFEDARVELRVEAGARRELQAREVAVPGAVPPTLTLRRRLRAVPPSAPRVGHPLRPWAIATTVAGAGLLAAGIGLLAWRESAAGAYAELGCEAMPIASATCVERYARFTDAGGAALGTLVTAAVVAATSGVLWYLDLRRPTSRAWGCAPSLAVVGCVVRF